MTDVGLSDEPSNYSLFVLTACKVYYTKVMNKHLHRAQLKPKTTMTTARH